MLSTEGVRGRVRALTELLRSTETVELLALDSRESFQSNKLYYQERLEQEAVPAIREMRRMYAYLLKHRFLNRDVVTAFVRAGLLYESCERFNGKYHNAVFVGKDENGVARHAHKRSLNSNGKTFRINVEGSDPRCSFHYTGTSDRLYVFEAPIDLLSFLDNVGMLQSEYKDWNEDLKARQGLPAQEAEKRELTESWLDLAVACAKIPVKYEADIIKQQQKQEQAATMKMKETSGNLKRILLPLRYCFYSSR